jgi:hypothetical protein
METSSGEKPILSVRIDPELLRRVDALAKVAGTGRAEIVERCLLQGLVDQEELVGWLKNGVTGPVLELLTHPAVLKVLLAFDRSGVDATSIRLRNGAVSERKSGKAKRGGKAGAP